jgi:predicted MFS family arabinose efflux permease
MVGPVMGSVIYGFVGYEYTFLAFAALLLACDVLVIFFLPQSLNNM